MSPSNPSCGQYHELHVYKEYLKRAIWHAIQQQIQIILVINKIDRLITGLQLPQNDAYLKLRSIIEAVNRQIVAVSSRAEIAQVVDPTSGNVCFASSTAGFSFTIQSFIRSSFSLRRKFGEHSHLQFWGDRYHDPVTNTFEEEPPSPEVERTFVTFVLEPLYKLCRAHKESFEGTLSELGLTPLGTPTGFVDMLVYLVPSAKTAALRKVDQIYSGRDSEIYRAMRECDNLGPLMVDVVKLYPRSGFSGFDALGRVYSGTIWVGLSVGVVLGQQKYLGDEDSAIEKEATELWVCQARSRIPLNSAHAGSWVLIKGMDSAMAKYAMKTASLCNWPCPDGLKIFRPLQFSYLPLVNTVVEPLEPLEPSDKYLMKKSLENISQSYPLATINIVEGKLTISGSGGFYLHCLLQDFSKHSKVEVKITDPVSSLRETVAESSTSCSAETSNLRNRITLTAELLVRSGNVGIDELLRSKVYLNLPAQSIWAFGPGEQGTNLLVDDTLTNEVDRTLLNLAKESIIKGFQRGVEEGPLCHEPIRNVLFRLVDAMIAPDPSNRCSTDIRQATEKALHSAFLAATPRLMEPVCCVEIQTEEDSLSVIRPELSSRRGYIDFSTRCHPQPGTSDYFIKPFIPLVESIGLESTLRDHFGEKISYLASFDHWALVPGDPLDESPTIQRLERIPFENVARKLMVNTRLRKGMDDCTVGIP